MSLRVGNVEPGAIKYIYIYMLTEITGRDDTVARDGLLPKELLEEKEGAEGRKNTVSVLTERQK